MRMVKALTVKMETVPMNGKGAQNLTCFVYEVYEGNSKMFFSRHLIWEVLRFQSIHFPLSDVLYLWDCLRVILHSGKYGSTLDCNTSRRQQ